MAKEAVKQASQRDVAEIEQMEGEAQSAGFQARAAANELLAHEKSNAEAKKIDPVIEAKVPAFLEEAVEAAVSTEAQRPAQEKNPAVEETGNVRPHPLGAEAPTHPQGADSPEDPFGAEDPVRERGNPIGVKRAVR